MKRSASQLLIGDGCIGPLFGTNTYDVALFFGFWLECHPVNAICEGRNNRGNTQDNKAEHTVDISPSGPSISYMCRSERLCKSRAI